MSKQTQQGISTVSIPSHWLLAEHIINITSITFSTLGLLLILATSYINRKQLQRAAIRLSLSISILSITYSICRLLAYSNHMANRPPITLLVLLWFTWASHLTVVLLSTIVCLHLLFTLLLKKTQWAFRMLDFYELVAGFIAFAATHPVMYVYSKIQWDKTNRSWILDDKLPLYGNISWAIYLGWIFLCIVVCLSIVVYVWMWQPFDKEKSSAKPVNLSVSSIGSSAWNTSSSGIGLMAWRNAAFAVIPIWTGIWMVVCALAPHRIGWLYGLALVMAASQGILCLILSVVNLGVLQNIRDARDRRTAEPKPSETELRLDFAKLDNTSTIHLSPYQSRGSSICQ